MRNRTVLVGMVFAFAAAWSGLSAQESGNERQKLPLERPSPLVMSKALASGGSVSLKVNVGDVEIVPDSTDGEVRLEIAYRQFSDAQVAPGWVKEFTVAANRAAIELQLPHNGHPGLKATLYVPKETSLKVDLGVGDLGVGNIEGDKNLMVGIGDLSVEVPDGKSYGYVEASTGIGDVNDPVFNLHQTGFLGKKEHKLLQEGKYRLRAHVHIGDLTLKSDRETEAEMHSNCWRTEEGSLAALRELYDGVRAALRAVEISA